MLYRCKKRSKAVISCRHPATVARGRAENPCTARDALEALRLAVAADLCMREGRPVRLGEVW
jgi:hypothetical protein